MQKHIDTIGTTERVSFPKQHIFDVPAKIDTGADSSSLWASDIQESTEGGLTFVAFGPGSRLYTGTPITTKTFRRVLVKNSFGVIEPRYKARLLLQIGDRKISAWFTLADRAGMKYPVLLGRRLLKNKFVVDVGKRQVHTVSDRPYRVLVLGAPGEPVREFLDEVAKQTKHETEFVARSFKDLSFWIEPSNVRVSETVTGRDIADFDLVYFKTHRKNYEFAIAAAEYLKFHHVNFIDEELQAYVAYDKLAEAMHLVLHDVPAPLTFCGSQRVVGAESAAIIDRLGSPFVCKEINADRSRQNYLLRTKDDIDEVLREAEPSDIFMLQQYVENDGYVRVLVFGAEPAVVIRRNSVSNDDPRKQHLNTPSGSDNATLLSDDDIPASVLQLATWAAKVMHRQVAGVDLIQDKQTGEWFVLEVNTAPQIRSGSFVDAKSKAFAKFIDFQLDR
jgi:glutathione synthase/RimK-type ligase-like ATP-grasp enzyme